MIIDDIYIKDKIKIYKATRSTISLDEIVEHLSSYIYHYPRKVFCLNHEIASDFYLYYLERIDNILLKYTQTEVKFITWFTYTLKNTYLNFANKIYKENKKLEKTLSLDAAINEEKLTLYDIVPAEGIREDDNINEVAKNIFNSIENHFEKRDSLIFALHNLELFISVIINPIKIFFNISVNEVYKIFETARSYYIKKYNSIIKIQDLISSINYRIKNYEKMNKNTAILKKRKEEYKKKIEKYRLLVPYSYIADLFKTSENAVNKIILKIKNYLKENNSLL